MSDTPHKKFVVPHKEFVVIVNAQSTRIRNVLQRLGVDYVAVYTSHNEELDQTLETLRRLVIANWLTKPGDRS